MLIWFLPDYNATSWLAPLAKPGLQLARTGGVGSGRVWQNLNFFWKKRQKLENIALPFLRLYLTSIYIYIPTMCAAQSILSFSSQYLYLC